VLPAGLRQERVVLWDRARRRGFPGPEHLAVSRCSPMTRIIRFGGAVGKRPQGPAGAPPVTTPIGPARHRALSTTSCWLARCRAWFPRCPSTGPPSRVSRRSAREDLRLQAAGATAGRLCARIV